MAADPQIELKRALDYLETISKGDSESLKNNVYKSFSGLCYLGLEAKRAKFKPGWASEVKDSNLNTLFHEKEASLIENIFLLLLKPMMNEKDEKQVGGAATLVPSTSKEGILSGLEKAASLINPDDISIDKTYWKVINFLKGLNEQTHALSREIGPFKFFYDSKVDIPIPIPIPFPPYAITLQIPPRTIPVLISSFVEAIRLIFSVGPTSNELTRKILSIVMAVIDLVQGEWKNSILSFAGYYGQYPLVAGVIGKVFLNVFSLVAPDIQDRLIFDMYRSGKSMFIGGFLWMFSTFAPASVRTLVKTQLDIIKDKVIKVNGDIQAAQDKMQETAGAAGMKVELNKIPETFIISFDDIQNLQSIARQPSFMCSKEFQDAIKPILIIIPARLFLEMLSIPTDPETLDMECGQLKGIPLDKTIEGSLTPTFTANAEGVLSQLPGAAALANPQAALQAAVTSKLPAGAEALANPQAALQAAVTSQLPAGAAALANPQAALQAAVTSKLPAGAAALANPEAALKGVAAAATDAALSKIPQVAPLKGAANAMKVLTKKKGGYMKNITRRTKPTIDRYATIQRIILETADI